MIQVRFPDTTVIFTYILFGMNILVFLIDSALGWLGVGYQGTGYLTLIGMKNNQAIIQGQLWRFLTPLFLHGGLLHIGFNSYFLYIFGPQVERMYGNVRFLIIYLLSGMTGTLFSFLFSQQNSIGASGALFGLMGAWVALLYQNRKLLANTNRHLRSILMVIGINLMIGLSPGIDNWGHLGGLVGGLILGLLITPRYRVRASVPGEALLEDQREPVNMLPGVVLFALGLCAAIFGAILLRR
jgi:rhomboid protease GluP